MKTFKILYQEVVGRIKLRESPDEIQSIAFLLMENIFGASRTDIVAEKPIPFETKGLALLDNYIARLNTGEPVQYVIGETYFFGRIFYVNPSVLIPRPETELLIQIVLSWKSSLSPARPGTGKVLDIGTGSGCIPITLSLEWPASEMYATDISVAALAVAKRNAAHHDVGISFLTHDILNEAIPLTEIDVIVSNPPYVTRNEAREMKENVLRFEPHGALFVPDDDPLIFYKEIVRKSYPALCHLGLLVVEINEKFGREVADLFRSQGFSDVSIISDMDGKPRVVYGVRRGQRYG